MVALRAGVQSWTGTNPFQYNGEPQPWVSPWPMTSCICKKPMLLYIPPGQTHIIHCPVHGDIVLYGPSITW